MFTLERVYMMLKQHKINEYVLEHPGAPLIDVLREARLTGEMGNSHELEDYMFIEGMVEGAPEVHVCASCGVSIAAGRTYCKECFQMLMRTVKHRAEYTKPSEEVVPRDPDRAAPIDVAELKRQAMLGGNEPNRPHGPGQEHVEEGKGKLRRYLGIIEYQE